MKRCPTCGRQWPDKGRFCPVDGTELQAEQPAEPQPALPAKLCPACGRTWPAKGRFCPIDGTALRDVTPAPTPNAKTCPKCGHQWPAKGRFCPVDGAALLEPSVAPDPRPAVDEHAAEEARWEAAAQKVREARRVALAEQAERTKQAAKAKQARDLLQVDGQGLRDSATVMIELPLDLDTLRPSAAPREAKQQKKFSDTQWFLKSVRPEELVEVGAGDDLEVASRDYEGAKPVDTGLREKFSLSDTYRHHVPKGGKPKASGDAFLNLDKKSGAKAKKKP